VVRGACIHSYQDTPTGVSMFRVHGRVYDNIIYLLRVMVMTYVYGYGIGYHIIIIYLHLLSLL